MKLSHLQVDNYRSLAKVDLDMRDLTVVIGPNGAGKTALVEVMQLLQQGSEEKLSSFLEARGGFSTVLRHRAEQFHLRLEIDVESNKSPQPMIYEVELGFGPRDVGYTITFERLEWQFDPNAKKPFRYIDGGSGKLYYTDPKTAHMVQPNWAYDPLELGLSQAPRMYEEPENLRRLLLNAQAYAALDVSPRSVVRLPQPLNPAARPGPNGENLFSALYNLRASDRDNYDRLLSLLRQGFAGFERLEFPVVGAGQVTMAWYEKDDREPFYLSQLSEGTLRFLWLATVLLAPPLPARILLDEPEVSLHPELLKLLAALLQQASAQCQIIVATHSPDLIRWLEPGEVLVADKEDGATRFTWADQMDLDEWLQDYTLSDLWLMGNLGGRP